MVVVEGTQPVSFFLNGRQYGSIHIKSLSELYIPHHLADGILQAVSRRNH